MKGHTKIELFDGLTGKLKERVEDDNMFTNAIDKLVNFAINHNYVQYSYSGQRNGLTELLSAHLNLVGGLLLFSTSLDENPDNVWAPSEAKLVGCGATSVINGDANIPVLGSYNASESDTSQTLSKKYVWDFATNQANGTIECVCLTNRIGGYVSYGIPDLMGTSTPIPYAQAKNQISLGNIMDRSKYGKNDASVYGETPINGGYVDFCIDSDNDLKYMFKVRNDGLDILSHKMSPEKFDIFRSAANIQSATVENYEGTFADAYYFHFYNTDEKALYLVGKPNNSAVATSNTSLSIHRFDMTARTLVLNYDSFNTPTNIMLSMASLACTATAEYMQSNVSYPNNVYKHVRGGGNNMSTISLAVAAATNMTATNTKPYILKNILHLGAKIGRSNSSYREALVDLQDDSVRFSILSTYVTKGAASPGNSYIIPPFGNTQLVFGTGLPMNGYLGSDLYTFEGEFGDNYRVGSTTFAPLSYLATINNISPVSKTSDKTMKITYTITAEEEE